MKTSSGFALLKPQCDGLYENTLPVCYEQPKCEEGLSGLNSAARSWTTFLSNKAFDQHEFEELCRQVCRSKKMPDRKSFGKMICGE